MHNYTIQDYIYGRKPSITFRLKHLFAGLYTRRISDNAIIPFYNQQQQFRAYLLKKIGHWQYGRNPYKHAFAFRYFTGSYIFPFVPLYHTLCCYMTLRGK